MVLRGETSGWGVYYKFKYNDIKASTTLLITQASQQNQLKTQRRRIQQLPGMGEAGIWCAKERLIWLLNVSHRMVRVILQELQY